MTWLVTAFLLLALEEFLYRLHRGASYRESDLAGTGTDASAEGDTGRLILVMRWVRTAQLLVFGVIFAIVATSSGFDILLTISGQLAGLLLLLQVARILTRKVIDRYSVLYTVVVLQALILGLLFIYGLDSSGQLVPADQTMDWLMSALAFSVLFLLSVAFSFSCTYIFRFFATEGSPLYYFMPPLVFTEYWTKRLVRLAAWTSLLVFVLNGVLFFQTSYPLGPATLQLAILAILTSSLWRFADRKRLRHPWAIVLTMAAWALNMAWVLGGLTAISGSWFD